MVACSILTSCLYELYFLVVWDIFPESVCSIYVLLVCTMCMCSTAMFLVVRAVMTLPLTFSRLNLAGALWCWKPYCHSSLTKGQPHLLISNTDLPLMFQAGPLKGSSFSLRPTTHLYNKPKVNGFTSYLYLCCVFERVCVCVCLSAF